MKTKKEEFFELLKLSRSAVLVGPLLNKEELNLIDDSPLLLVDGGMDMALEHSLEVGRSCFSVGDGDSSKQVLDEKIPVKKDFSDLAYALELLPTEVEKIELYGFLGGRADHELCNLGEVFRFLKKKDSATLVKIGPALHVLSSGSWSFSGEGNFSLISFEKLEVELTGDIAYELVKDSTLEAFTSHGLSNEASGKASLIINAPVFLYGEGFIIKAE